MAVAVMTVHPSGPGRTVCSICPLPLPRTTATGLDTSGELFLRRAGHTGEGPQREPRRAGDDRESSMQSSVPVIDLTPWLSGGETGRAGVAAQVDAALQSVGFFLITGHGVPDELRARVRARARAFFALPR